MATPLAATVRGRRSGPQWLGILIAMAALASACSQGASNSTPAASPSVAASPGGSGEASADASTATPQPSGAVNLYTSVAQGTVDAVVAAYTTSHPEVTVNVFRAPTGELAGKIATELRSGGIKADILWLTDPLSIQAYAEQGLLKVWQPTAAAGIDAAYHSDTFWGTRFLNMVMVQGASVTPGLASWHDLVNPAYKDAVGIPDPGFAGSAFGALGYFDQTAGFGLDFYRALKANGATQVKSPDEVTTGVAEGRFKVGMTLDFSARSAITKGSPIKLVWPSDGAIAMYSPIGVVDVTANAPAAESFVELVLSDPGQQAVAGTGWQPIRSNVGGPTAEGSQVYPDWTSAFGRQTELLAEYRAIFGG
ncbi:MAG: extracellular solute-binding protein [Candidatus Limnocylindrales bacterium]